MIIGITGKSGTGKSHLAEILKQELSAEIINFDKVSHLTIETDSFKTLVKKWNIPSVFDNKGNIIRKKLGDIVFEDKEKLNQINNLSEKLMTEIIDEMIQKSTAKYIILEYALLPLMKFFNECDIKILITATESIRFERIINRDQISEEYFKKRDANSINYIPALFDIVVENNTNDTIMIHNILNLIKSKENLWLEKPL